MSPEEALSVAENLTPKDVIREMPTLGSARIGAVMLAMSEAAGNNCDCDVCASIRALLSGMEGI